MAFFLFVILMGKEATWLPILINYIATCSCHLFKNGGSVVNFATETDFFLVVSVHLCSSETHIFELFISNDGTDSLMGFRVVHVLVHGGEASPRMVNIVSLLEWAFIELINVTGVKVMCNVKHFFFFI